MMEKTVRYDTTFALEITKMLIGQSLTVLQAGTEAPYR